MVHRDPGKSYLGVVVRTHEANTLEPGRPIAKGGTLRAVRKDADMSGHPIRAQRGAIRMAPSSRTYSPLR
jgi:hypothetical protein